MNARELMNVLSGLPPETEIVINPPSGCFHVGEIRFTKTWRGALGDPRARPASELGPRLALDVGPERVMWFMEEPPWRIAGQMPGKARLLDENDNARDEFARELARGRTPPHPCTGLSARWCPRHGDCTCEPLNNGEPSFNDGSCPLHSLTSDHGERSA